MKYAAIIIALLISSTAVRAKENLTDAIMRNFPAGATLKCGVFDADADQVIRRIFGEPPR
jgi:hypothetical protein